MFNNDNYSDNVKDLSFMVYEAYMKCESISEFNENIMRIPNVNKYSITYLKSLRHFYIRNYASGKQKKEYAVKKKIMNSRVPEFFVFCDELFSLPYEERFNYAFNSGLSLNSVSIYLERYKKNNGKYKEYVDSFFEEYISYFENAKKIKKQNRVLNFVDEACDSYQNLVDLGFYCVQDYCEYICSNRVDARRLEAKFPRYKKSISDYNSDLLEYYFACMNRNRIDSFYMLKDKIDYFYKRMQMSLIGQDSLDIIDYYMLFGMPLRKFKNLCKDLIDLSLFNSYFSHAFLLEQGSLSDYRIDNDYIINGRLVTNDDKMVVLNFMHQNGIPYYYFAVALRKYILGGLDEYLCSNVKVLNNK